MRNLKKVLALVLTFAMAFSMLAFAADFTDSTDIANKDAVNMMASLGIIKGYTDGSYQPDKIVTRAEMAKMIYVMKNGGVDDGAAYYTGISTGLSDIKGHWAEGYISYCYTLGIIAGKGNGKFDPNAPVTGLEAAKMLLVVIGYNADKAGLVGSSWATKVAALASDAGLFSGYKVALDAGCPRDFAALLLYNALDASTVKWSEDSNEYVESDTETVGGKYLDLKTYEGILDAVGDYGLGISAGDDKIKVAVDKEDGAKIKADDVVDVLFDYEGDVSALLGQYVKVTTNGDNTKGEEEIYGITPVASKNTVVVSNLAKSDTTPYSLTSDNKNKIKVNGTVYKYEDTALVYLGSVKQASTAFSAETFFNGYQNPSEVTFIDNDGDSQFDLALIVPVLDVKKVTYVSSTGFTAGSSYKFDDVTVYDGIAKGDYVVRTTDYVTGDDKFVKADVVSGKITGVQYGDYYTNSLTDDPISKVQIGGTWYSLACNEDHSQSYYAGDTVANDSTFDLIVYAGFAFDGDKKTAGSTDVAMVTGMSNSKNLDGAYDTKLLLGDGTTKTVSAKVIKEYNPDGSVKNFDTTNSNDQYVARLVTYDVSDGIYELDLVGSATTGKTGVNTAGYDEVKSDIDDDTGAACWDGETKLLTQTVADDAIIFVAAKKSSGGFKYSVISGATLNDIDSTFGTSGYALYNKTGMYDVEIASIKDINKALPGATANTVPAYVLSAQTTLKIDGTTYNQYTVWTPDGNKTVYVEGSGNKLQRDALYSLDLDSEGYVNNFSDITSADWTKTAVAVTGYSESRSLITINGNTYDISDDVEYLYVDSEARAGIDGGEPSVASEVKTNKYYRNAMALFDSDGKVLYVAFDVVNGYMRGLGDIENDLNLYIEPTT